MKIRLIILIGLTMLLQGCYGQKRDLATLTFTEKESAFFGDIPHKFDLSVRAETYEGFYETESEELLNFNGVDLSDYKTEKGKFGTNYIQFAFTKKDSILCYYYLTLFTKSSIEKTINALKTKFGMPKYADAFEKEKKPDAYLWIDKNIIYLFIGVTKKSAWLRVFKMDNKELFDNEISGPFQYYYDYLEYLKENNKTEKEVSYYQFAKIEEADGDMYYIESYVKPFL